MPDVMISLLWLGIGAIDSNPSCGSTQSNSRSLFTHYSSTGPILSKDSSSLFNLHSHNFSDLADHKTVCVALSTLGLAITTRASTL